MLIWSITWSFKRYFPLKYSFPYWLKFHLNKVGWKASVMLKAMIYLFPWLGYLLKCFRQTMFQWQLLVEGAEFYPYLPGLEDSPPRDFRDQVIIIDLFAILLILVKMENIFKYRTFGILLYLYFYSIMLQDTAGVKQNHSRWRKEAIEFSRHVMMSFSFQKAVGIYKADFSILNLDKTSRRKHRW